MAVALRDNYSGTATPYEAFVMNAANDWGGTTFTTTVSYSLSRIDIWCAKGAGDNVGTITVALYAVDGSGHPTGLALASGTIADASVPETGAGYEWVSSTMSSAYVVSSSTKYAIVVSGTSLSATNILYWSGDDDGAGSSDYANGDKTWSVNGGSTWSIDTTSDMLFRCYGDTDAGTPALKTYSKRLLAIGNNELWQESTSGTMSELAAASGYITTDENLNAMVAFQKLFIANGTRLKVADFVNSKLSTADISSGANLPPDRNTILTGGSSGATMVVDYIDAINGATLVYGKRTSTATFTSGETVTGTNPTGSVYVGAVSFVLDANEVANPHWYDWTVYGGDATNFGAMPTQANQVCNFMGCPMLSGDSNYPHQWYMARQLNPWDWLYAQDDAQSAVAGNDADAGEVGDIIVVNIPYKDDYVIHACANTLWYMTGHPCQGGTILELDLTTGILGDRAFCWDDASNLYLICTVGILKIPPGFGQPENITIDIWPDFIDDLAYDSSLHRLSMFFDPEERGIHIHKTTLSDGSNSAWWYDLRSEGLFPDSYAAGHGVFSGVYYQAQDPTYRKLYVGCFDGYIRYWDKSTKNDDSTAINSYVGFAPLSLSTTTRKDGKITNIDIVTGGGGAAGSQTDSDDVTCEVHVARTASKIIEKLDGGATPKMTKTFSAPGYDKSNLDRRSVRGQWGGIVLSNNTAGESWAMERLILDTKEVGRSL
jgi:hypothetical protein